MCSSAQVISPGENIQIMILPENTVMPDTAIPEHPFFNRGLLEALLASLAGGVYITVFFTLKNLTLLRTEGILVIFALLTIPLVSLIFSTDINLFRFVLASLAQNATPLISSAVPDDIFIRDGRLRPYRIIANGYPLPNPQHVRLRMAPHGS